MYFLTYVLFFLFVCNAKILRYIYISTNTYIYAHTGTCTHTLRNYTKQPQIQVESHLAAGAPSCLHLPASPWREPVPYTLS